MIQYFLFLISFIFLSIVPIGPEQDIKISLDAEPNVWAGEEMIVSLEIDKGSLQSFSRFTQSLPYGLTAERLETANADFSFEDQRLRIIWLKLPVQEKITVSYKIKVDPRLTGSFSLEGEFAYVESNQRKTVDVDAGFEISITPNPEIAEEKRINIDDFQAIAIREEAGGFNQMAVTRSKPVKANTFEYTVELQVNKNNLSKFAKIEEYVPEGFRIVEGDSKEGIFSFNQGMVKILWMNLPEEEEFTVSYNVVPDPGKSIEEFEARGNFSYITGNETQTIAIVEKNYDLAEKTTETSVEPNAGAQVEEAGQDESMKEESAAVVAAAVVAIDQDSPEEEIIDEPVQIKEQPVEAKTEPDPSPEKVVKKPAPENPFILQPEDGIYYRVQLAAGHNEVNIQKYFSRRMIRDEVKMEFHDGWRKYTVGSFYAYKDARDRRVDIRSNTPIKGAFVSAYSNGERITVQEALMVSNQKWFK